MKVHELISLLARFPADAEIRINNWNDCSYKETTSLEEITYYSHKNIIVFEEYMPKR